MKNSPSRKPAVIVIFGIFFFLLAICVSAQTIRRVHPTASGANVYNNFADAHSAASNGDIIHMEANVSHYGNIDISKQLHIIGTGYYLDDNPETQHYNTSGVEFYTVTFNAGSENSIIEGVKFIDVIANADDITVKRCFGYSLSGAIKTSKNRLKVIQSFFSNTSSNTSVANSNIQITGGDDHEIKNNIIVRSHHTTSIYALYITSSANNVLVKNNVIRGVIDGQNTTFVNNISGRAATATTFIQRSNSIYQNNLEVAAHAVLDNSQINALGNLTTASLGDIFLETGLDPSKEEYWDYETTSPSNGAGVGGADIGHFGGGGDDYYRKSGMPGIPAIYEATVPSNAASLLNIVIKAKSHTN